MGRGWWAGFSEKTLSPGTTAEQLAETSPPGEAPQYRPWGRRQCWGQGQKALAEDGAPGTGRTGTAPASKGKRGHFGPSKEEPTPAVCPRRPGPWRHMRSRPGQGAREAPRGQRGVLRQPWPLILLGLAVGAHGLLPPTAAPRNTAPHVEAPVGKSPWSLWDR